MSANEVGRPNGHAQHDEAALRWIECRITDPPMLEAIKLGQFCIQRGDEIASQKRINRRVALKTQPRHTAPNKQPKISVDGQPMGTSSMTNPDMILYFVSLGPLCRSFARSQRAGQAKTKSRTTRSCPRQSTEVQSAQNLDARAARRLAAAGCARGGGWRGARRRLPSLGGCPSTSAAL